MKKIIVIVLVLIPLIMLLVLPFLLVAPRGFSSRFSSCKNNLQKLGIAIYLYREEYNSFPPPCTFDSHGKPMHSWRALLLPYIESECHDRIKYNYNEPWNSPYNKQFHDKMPNLFCCSFVPKSSRKSVPSYAMLTGKNTISDCLNSRSLKDMNFTTTILLIEIKNANFNWLEPVDIHFEQLQYAYNVYQEVPNLIGSYHNSSTRNFNILTCDGTVHSISYKTTDIEIIRAMTTIDGAKSVIEKNDKKTGEKYYEFQTQKLKK
jgi:hypothetical protein